MARENYSFKKHQKELANKKKREEKRLNKLNKSIEAKAQLALTGEKSAETGVNPGQASDDGVDSV